MLEALRDWAAVLSGVMIFGALCEVILPSGSFQKYIRLAVGLLLVFTLMTPFLEILHLRDADSGIFNAGESAYLAREEMEEKQRAEVLLLYQKSLNQKMMASIKNLRKRDDVEVRCSVCEEIGRFGAVDGVLVLVRAAPSEKDTEKIRQLMRQEYGVAEDQITLRYIKEREG